jgi:hypothetical protein
MGSGRALEKCAYMTERFSWDLNRKRELCSKYLVQIVYTFVRPYDAPYLGGHSYFPKNRVLGSILESEFTDH